MEQGIDKGGESKGLEESLKFLESLLLHYESLVGDMSVELNRCQQELRNLNTENENPPLRGSTNVERTVCDQCVCKDHCIENLRQQLEMAKKANTSIKTLWQTSLEHIEKLETQNLSRPLTITTALPQRVITYSTARQEGLNQNGNAITADGVLMKMKLMQVYAAGLETRIEKAVREKNLYRNKLLEIKLESEVKLKKQAVQQARDIEHTKLSFKNELTYLKESLEKSRKQHQLTMEKELQKEREFWTKSENKRVKDLQFQLEQIMMNRDAMIIRESQLIAHLRDMGKEILQNRAIISNIQVQQTKQTQFETQPSLQKLSLLPLKISRGDQTNKYLEVESQRLKELQKQLSFVEEECKNQMTSKLISEKEAEIVRSRLEVRIRELESLNAALQGQLINEKEKFKISQAQATKPIEVIVNHNCSACTNKPTVQEGSDVEEKILGETKHQILKNVNAEIPAFNIDVNRVEEKRRDLREISLTNQIQALTEDRNKLLAMIEAQRSVSARWEREYRRLLNY